MFLVIGLNKIMMAAPMNTWLKSEINENAYSKVNSNLNAVFNPIFKILISKRIRNNSITHKLYC